ncbi:MAG: peroxidase family protein [Gaiellaceae bacterium]
MSTVDEGNERSRYSRRGFLKRAGAGAGALALGGGVAGAFSRPVQASQARSLFASTGTQTFGRLFPNLEAFAPVSNGVTKSLLALGAQGGLLDANDQLSAGPINLITNPALSVNNPDNPTHTAGTTFMGQFIDHDTTFDTTSKLGVTTDPFTAPNARTASLDLDSVYGNGPSGSAALYNSSDPAKLLIESGGTYPDGTQGFEDLPRMGDGTAITGDPRNDENMMIAGLHCAFILFHNRQVDDARSNGKTYPDDYNQARQLTTWHYHWMVLHEFLPLFVGPDMVNDVLQNGRRFYTVGLGEAFMPVEFQGACYRFGHSMVRPSYRANLKGNNDGSPLFGFIFDPGQNSSGSDPTDLRGGFRAPRRFIGWQTFFDFGDGQIKRNKQVDTHISSPLFTLPLGAIASHNGPTVLPQRNLLRQLTWSLPSGQSIAKAMGITSLSKQDLSELKPYGFDTSTPLWYYALKEAQLSQSGLHLGPVAGRIVAEVLIGLIQSDPNSYVNVNPSWAPTVPIKNASLGFRMTDFLTYAGVDPTSRHAQNPTHA